MNDILSQTVTTGADGMVGSYVDFGIKTNRLSLDVTNPHQVSAIINAHQPKAILHLAAITDMDQCETEPVWADLVNHQGTMNMAIVAEEVGAKMVYISTNAVFDGSKAGSYLENDYPNPRNYYGRTKLAGEVAVQLNSSNFLIVRSSWIFGGGPEKDKKFVGKIVKKLLDPKVNDIEAINDRRGTPTYAKDLVAAVRELIPGDTKGIVHVANYGICTRYDMVLEIAKFFGINKRIIPVSASQFSGSANQLVNESLSSMHYNETRPWQDALIEYLRTEWGHYRES
jgi:dTDP-4-dehydrorhamnose reductase